MPQFIQLDVFTERPGGGNPLGVVIGAEDWSDARMQAFAAWTDLVETTFLLRATVAGASYRLRIFTPTREIPFAGHPTIGSAHAAIDCGFVAPVDNALVQQCGTGLVPLRVVGDGAERRLFLQSPAAQIRAEGLDADPQLRFVLADRKLGQLGVALVSGGRNWWMAELADEAQVRSWHPNHDAIAALARASDSVGLCVFARCTGQPFDLVVRAFPGGVGIIEDPASGAANGLIAAFIAQREGNGSLARGYRVSQGREMGHDASIDVQIDEDGSNWVGGRSHIVISGSVDWPE
jgi:PhzF family phenazine biosynthesis protein